MPTLDAGREMEKPLAHQYWDAKRHANRLETDVEEAIMRVLGFDPNQAPDYGYCGFSHITQDDYDASFELKGCTTKFVLTNEQKAQFRALGFAQCWFCEQGPSEYDAGNHVYFKEAPCSTT